MEESGKGKSRLFLWLSFFIELGGTEHKHYCESIPLVQQLFWRRNWSYLHEYEGNQNELPTKMFCVALSFVQMISSDSIIYLRLMSKSETFSSTLLSPCSCKISGKLQNETLANSQESFVFVLQVCCYCHCCASRELSETFTLRRPTRNCCDFIFYPYYIYFLF